MSVNQRAALLSQITQLSLLLTNSTPSVAADLLFLVGLLTAVL